MQVGNRYLVVETKDERKFVREWECVEIAKTAIKFHAIIAPTNWIFTGSAEKDFWILNSKIDQSGQTEYQIIEEIPQ